MLNLSPEGKMTNLWILTEGLEQSLDDVKGKWMKMQMFHEDFYSIFSGKTALKRSCKLSS